MTATGDLEDDFKAITGPLALIYGADSASFSEKSAAHMKSLNDALEVEALADAQHHLFLDQPQAFMDSLSAILARWA